MYNIDPYIPLFLLIIMGEHVGTHGIDLFRYHIYPKYTDILTPYHTCSKIWTSTVYYLLSTLLALACLFKYLR